MQLAYTGGRPVACWDSKGRQAKHPVGHKTGYRRAEKLPALGLDHLTDTRGSGRARQIFASAGVRVKTDGLIGRRRGRHGRVLQPSTWSAEQKVRVSLGSPGVGAQHLQILNPPLPPNLVLKQILALPVSMLAYISE